jgi:uncharacterized protein YggL (DUF469 family)
MSTGLDAFRGRKMNLNTGEPDAQRAPWRSASTMTAVSNRHARLNRRKHKKLGLGEYARVAMSVQLTLDPTLDARAAAVVRRAVLDTIDTLRLTPAGVFHRHHAELILQPRVEGLDEQTLAHITGKVRTTPGVVAVETVLHGDVWVDEAGRRHRPLGTSVIPRVRDLFRRSVAISEYLKDMTPIVPKR